MKITSKDLYDEKTVFTRRGKLQKKLTPSFKVRTITSPKTVFRDIPTKVFQVIVNQAFIHTPEIVFAICLGAFAGLRPGEVCNVRQGNSHLGRGLSVTAIDGVVKMVELDLSAEYVLRSDGVKCGGIKKERRQRVYPAFLPAFYKAYELHKKLLQDGFEKDYCPMFVGKSGMAMTYHDYRSKFQRLITEHVRPVLLTHEDPECRLYGQLLYERKLGPHALRHWYSVQLVLMGEDVAGLQYWRGDTSSESALLYLQNKGDLIKELSAANNLLADFLMSEALLGFMAINNYFGLQKVDFEKNLSISQSKSENIRPNLELWLRSYGLGSDEKLKLLTDRMTDLFPKTGSLFAKFTNHSQADSNILWKLADYLCFALSGEITEMSGDELDGLAENVDCFQMGGYTVLTLVAI